jgi:hypothetical protein
VNEELQPFPGESSAGGSLEVALEADGLARIGEGNGGFDPPRTVSGGMRHFTGIVPPESSMQVVGVTDMIAFGIVDASKDIDV